LNLNEKFFLYLCKEGAKKRNINLEDPIYKNRFKHELEVIKEGNLIDYHLIVQDMINWAKKEGIMVGLSRGSSAGSLICYLLGITGVDPLKYGLIFERYLSRARFKTKSGQADIDVDYMASRRDEVFDYLKEKYGNDCVARVPNLVRYHVKQAIRDLSRVNKIPISEVNIVTKKIPNGISLEEAMEIPEVKKFCNKYPEVGEILPELYGTIKMRSIHAGAVVVSDKPIEEYASIERVSQTDCICFDKDALESIGFVKYDCLSLKILDVLARTLDLIKETTGEKIELPTEFEDKKVYETIFQKGLTLGVHQFESQLLTNTAKKLQINDFNTLVDCTSIIRPGTLRSGDADKYIKRKLGEEEVTYQHPLLEPILKNTQGIIIYQEQQMKIANQVAGMPLEETEILRKLISKSKGVQALDEYKDKFIKGCIVNDVSEEVANEIWQSIREAANYSFNFSHAIGYSGISFQCAWLKTYYPKQFLTALMEFEKDEILLQAVGELRELGFNVLYPDINESKESTMIKENGDIIFGFGDIENIGPKSVEDIIAKQPYSSFEDFMERRDTRVTNIRVIRHLIQSGAFDKFGRRDELYYRISPDEEYQEWDDREMILRQLEVLDMPPEIPLIDFYDCPFDIETISVNEIDWEDVQDEIYIKGVISKVVHKVGYSLFNLTAEGGTINVLVGEEIVERFSPILEVGIPVLVKAHQVKDRERLYGDFILPFENYEKYEKEIRYISGESQEQLKYLKEQGGRGEYDLVVSASTFTSKRGNKGCRIVFASGERLMSFNHEKPIYAGDILQYHLSKHPFINIISRY